MHSKQTTLNFCMALSIGTKRSFKLGDLNPNIGCINKDECWKQPPNSGQEYWVSPALPRSDARTRKRHSQCFIWPSAQPRPFLDLLAGLSDLAFIGPRASISSSDQNLALFYSADTPLVLGLLISTCSRIENNAY